jgi:hypothetical protein
LNLQKVIKNYCTRLVKIGIYVSLKLPKAELIVYHYIITPGELVSNAVLGSIEVAAEPEINEAGNVAAITIKEENKAAHHLTLLSFITCVMTLLLA